MGTGHDEVRMSRSLEVAERLVNGVSRILAALSAIGVGIILLMVSVNLFSRSAGGHGVSGLVEYGEVLVVLVVYLPLAYAQVRREHIAVDIVTSRLRGRVRYWYESMLALLLAAFCFWFCAVTFTPALDSIVDQEFRFGLVSVPLWPARVAISVGFAALGLRYVLDALIGFRRISEWGSTESVPKEA